MNTENNTDLSLSSKDKSYIDSLSIFGLLYVVRFAPVGDPRMSGKRGDYWLERLGKLRAQDEAAYVRASKDMGWGS